MAMGTTECSREALDAAAETLAGQGAVYMINMVRYRAEADYGEERDLPPCSGREAYFQRYAPAFAQVARGEDYSVFWVGNVRGMLASAHGEAWDDVVIVRYSCFSALRRILESEAYKKEAAPHRRAALADWRFIATTQFSPA
jgi:hypothetical protein